MASVEPGPPRLTFTTLDNPTEDQRNPPSFPISLDEIEGAVYLLDDGLRNGLLDSGRAEEQIVFLQQLVLILSNDYVAKVNTFQARNRLEQLPAMRVGANPVFRRVWQPFADYYSKSSGHKMFQSFLVAIAAREYAGGVSAIDDAIELIQQRLEEARAEVQACDRALKDMKSLMMGTRLYAYLTCVDFIDAFKRKTMGLPYFSLVQTNDVPLTVIPDIRLVGGKVQFFGGGEKQKAPLTASTYQSTKAASTVQNTHEWLY